MQRLKALGLAVMAALAVGPAHALIQPLSINFQGKLVNPTTNAPQTGVALMTFSLYNAPSGGAALWTEGPDGVSLTNGVFNVNLGTNTALSRDLFIGASAYLEITVNSVNGVADGAVMTPRQRLLMAPYAFSANQLSDATDVRLIAGTIYSTFTSAGNLIVPAGVQASSGSFTNGITASSGTFSASIQASTANFTFSGSTWTIVSSSGIQISTGVLQIGQSNLRYFTDDPVALETDISSNVAIAGNLRASAAKFTSLNSTWTVQSSSGIVISTGVLQIGQSGLRYLTDDPVSLATVVSSNVVITGNISAANLNSVFLASATLTAAAATLTVNFNAANYSFLVIDIFVPSVVATDIWQVRFNGDSAANYGHQVSQNSAASTATNNAAQAALGTANNANGGYCRLTGTAILNFVKQFNATCTRGTGSTAPTMINASFDWNNTAAWITSLTLLNSAATNFGAGTSVRVYGER